jgi:hypothetical protein
MLAIFTVCWACAMPAKAKMAAAATAFNVERLFMDVSSLGLKLSLCRIARGDETGRTPSKGIERVKFNWKSCAC